MSTSPIEFTKMHGAGNDFVVLDNRRYGFEKEFLSTLAAAWCRRRYGVGADGLLALEDAEGAADYRMRYVNADGSWATMCGNGARCLAQFAVDAGIAGRRPTFKTDAGAYKAAVLENNRVRLFVPAPTRLSLDVDLSDSVPEGLSRVHFVHTGTEHLVTFVDDVGAVPVDAWGGDLRRDASMQPAGANANFVESCAGHLRVRTYEKGVEAETPSCGTGVLAAATVAKATRRVDAERVTVETPGGTLSVGERRTEDGRAQYLEGPVTTVFQGTIVRP